MPGLLRFGSWGPSYFPSYKVCLLNGDRLTLVPKTCLKGLLEHQQLSKALLSLAMLCPHLKVKGSLAVHGGRVPRQQESVEIERKLSIS